MLNIRVKYHADIEPIAQAHDGEWYDLRLAESTVLWEGDYRLLSLGVSIELPEGYEALVFPRSSTFDRYGILMANSGGVIDHRYCGDDDIWRFPAYATRYIEIPANTRIAQFRLVPVQPESRVTAVDHLGNANRGGIGSTGR